MNTSQQWSRHIHSVLVMHKWTSTEASVLILAIQRWAQPLTYSCFYICEHCKICLQVMRHKCWSDACATYQMASLFFQHGSLISEQSAKSTMALTIQNTLYTLYTHPHTHVCICTTKHKKYTAKHLKYVHKSKLKTLHSVLFNVKLIKYYIMSNYWLFSSFWKRVTWYLFFWVTCGYVG